MLVELRQRTADHAALFFYQVQQPSIKRWLPLRASTVAEALEDFARSQRADARSYGQTIYVDGKYVGDIWCYALHEEAEPDAMISYCVFDMAYWGQGIATQALELFVQDVRRRFQLRTIGAFTYEDNVGSTRVLEANGFILRERVVEESVASCYFQLDMD